MLAFEGSKHNVIISINHLQKYCFIGRYFKSRKYSESYRNNIDASLRIVSNENFRYCSSLPRAKEVITQGGVIDIYPS